MVGWEMRLNRKQAFQRGLRGKQGRGGGEDDRAFLQ